MFVVRMPLSDVARYAGRAADTGRVNIPYACAALLYRLQRKVDESDS